MFLSGTKVYVHHSSISGRSAGPKAHSIGYAVSKLPDTFVNKSYCKLCGSPAMYSKVNVVFTRYGLEKTRRREYHRVINILPLTSKKATGTIVKRLINNLKKEFDWSQYGVRAGCIMTPAGAGTREDMVAWAKAVINSAGIDMVIHNQAHMSMLKADKNILYAIAQAREDKSRFESLIGWAQHNAESTATFTSILQYVNAIANRVALKKRTNHFSGNKYMEQCIGLFEINRKESDYTRNLSELKKAYMTFKPKHT